MAPNNNQTAKDINEFITPYVALCLTADGDVAQLHTDSLVQGETPWSLLRVAGVTAVRVASAELWVAQRQVGVAVRVLRVPGLTLTTRLGLTDRPTVG